MNAGERPDTLRLAAVALVFAIALCDTAARQGLYADGGSFLVLLLWHQVPTATSPARIFAELLTQLPVLAALKLGISKLQTLILIHSAAIIFIPATFWTLALIRLIRDNAFWSLFVVFCIVHFNVAFFAIGEFNIAYSLYALSLAILASRSEISPAWAATALFAAVCLIAVYETMVGFGPLLAILAGARLMRTQVQSGTVKTLLILCIVFYIVGACIAGISILYPRHPANQVNAINALNSIAHLPFLAISIAFVFGYAATFAQTALARRLGHLVAIACLLAMLWPNNWTAPSNYYLTRTTVGLVVLGYGCILAGGWLFDRGPFQILREYRLTTMYPLLLFLAMSVSDIVHSWQFARFVEVFRTEVDSRSGLVPVEETKLTTRDNARYGWGWTYPSMSVLLRHDANRAIILNPNGYSGFQPFNPLETVPDLGAYYRSNGN